VKYSDTIHLLGINPKITGTWPEEFPYNLPIIRHFSGLEFDSPVTFFVGENGCGKSTFLESIACAAGSTTVGRESVQQDKSLIKVRKLAKDFRLTWSKKTNRGFFMRAEDFIGFARKMVDVREDLQENLRQVEEEYKDRSETARIFARSAYLNELGAMRREYGDKDLDERSHGEGFLTLFQARFVPSGLYLMDEPETPLSPMRQLAFLVLLEKMVKQKAQFIIATHSPIIMAFPGAAIYNFDHGSMEKIAYDDIEHVRVTKSFLENPARYLHLLLDE
jgi:predicted ATPase